jgi:hypothetical protein
MAALLLSHAEGLQRESARTLPELEHLLLQRWARATIQVLRTAAHDPGALRHPAGSGLEARRVLDQAARLQPVFSPRPGSTSGNLNTCLYQHFAYNRPLFLQSLSASSFPPVSRKSAILNPPFPWKTDSVIVLPASSPAPPTVSSTPLRD